MQSHHESALKSHISTLNHHEKSNVKSHVNAAGDDEKHSSAKIVMNWVGGIVGSSAIAGLSWKAVKAIVNKHL